MLQLVPPVPVNTPRGEGFTHVLMDYGLEPNLYCTMLNTEAGEIGAYASQYVRACNKVRVGRVNPKLPRLPDEKSAHEVPVPDQQPAWRVA